MIVKNYAKRKLRSLIKTHGGKAYLARRILAHFPPHQTYVEPYFGGGNILLNKIRAPNEFVGDIDSDLIRFWQVVQTRGQEFAAQLAARAYDEPTFLAAREFMHSPTRILADDLQHALEFVTCNRQSRGGLGIDFAWSTRLRGGQPGDLNGWETMLRDHLPRVIERLRGVMIKYAPGIELILEHDGTDTLTYCDPPYLHETRTAREIYEFEMSRQDHENLLDVLLACRGAVVLSGYGSKLYDTRLAGWRRIAFDMPNHSAQGKTKQRRQEILWINR